MTGLHWDSCKQIDWIIHLRFRDIPCFKPIRSVTQEGVSCPKSINVKTSSINHFPAFVIICHMLCVDVLLLNLLLFHDISLRFYTIQSVQSYRYLTVKYPSYSDFFYIWLRKCAKTTVMIFSKTTVSTILVFLLTVRIHSW